MDFDLQTLHPTYKLLLNQVGASRALWIAEKVVCLKTYCQKLKIS